jgi:hypothetical protein
MMRQPVGNHHLILISATTVYRLAGCALGGRLFSFSGFQQQQQLVQNAQPFEEETEFQRVYRLYVHINQLSPNAQSVGICCFFLLFSSTNGWRGQGCYFRTVKTIRRSSNWHLVKKTKKAPGCRWFESNEPIGGKRSIFYLTTCTSERETRVSL